MIVGFVSTKKSRKTLSVAVGSDVYRPLILMAISKPRGGFDMAWPFQNHLTRFNQPGVSLLTSKYIISIVINL